MKVFSKEKFLKLKEGKVSWGLLGEIGIPENERWPSVCDGKTPEECNKLGWAINDKWCVEKGEILKMGKKYKIEIVCDGDKVTQARMIVNGEIVKIARAFRNPEDKFNFRVGAEYAFNRLFEKKKVEHDGCEGCVWEHDDEEKCTARDCRNVFCYPENLKKPDKYVKKNGFNLGDRVVCHVSDDAARAFGVHKVTNGEHGRIVENRSYLFSDWLAVEFDRAIKGAHDGNGAGKEGHVYWIPPRCLTHE